MPYIDATRRYALDPQAKGDVAKTPGELNYQITQLCLDYLDKHMQGYQWYNDVIGALECAKLEMYRKRISLYEDKKAIENGEIY